MTHDKTHDERRIIEGVVADVYVRIGTVDDAFERACAFNDLRLCNIEMAKIRKREEAQGAIPKPVPTSDAARSK